MTDKELILMLAEGRYEAVFNTLVKEYSERLYWHLRLFTASHEDADDLLQEVFIKLWQVLPTFRGESSFYTWLYRIATNEAISWRATVAHAPSVGWCERKSATSSS